MPPSTTVAVAPQVDGPADVAATELTPAGDAPATTVAPAPAVAEAWTLEPYRGLGAWLDAFDWTAHYTRSDGPAIDLGAIDHLADEGVQTLYLQAARWDYPDGDLIEPDRLAAIIDRAHERGMAVVAWYLPTLEDPAADLRRMLALAALDIEGLAVDIESRVVPDVAERNRRLLELSAALRAELGPVTIGGIVLEPVLMEDVNPRYWPGFPWAGLAEHYDVWLPMSYWTNRRGFWRDAYEYTKANVERLRAHIGDPDAPVHAIGGIGDRMTDLDLVGFGAATAETGAIGASLYDYRTTAAQWWAGLRQFRTAP